MEFLPSVDNNKQIVRTARYTFCSSWINWAAAQEVVEVLTRDRCTAAVSSLHVAYGWVWGSCSQRREDGTSTPSQGRCEDHLNSSLDLCNYPFSRLLRFILQRRRFYSEQSFLFWWQASTRTGAQTLRRCLAPLEKRQPPGPPERFSENGVSDPGAWRWANKHTHTNNTTNEYCCCCRRQQQQQKHMNNYNYYTSKYIN